jgi:hypothetical protein
VEVSKGGPGTDAPNSGKVFASSPAGERLGSVRGERFRDKRRSVRREQGQEKSAIEREPLQVY